METEYGDRWNFGKKARIALVNPGGISACPHRIELSERLLISYLAFVPVTKDVKEFDLVV